MRCYGDGMAFVRLLRFMQGEKDTFHDVAPVVRGDGDVELAIDMLGSNRQVQTEALAMLLRYKIIDKRFVQLLLGFLEEPIEVSFLAAKLLRDMVAQGLVCSIAAPIISRALIGAGPLVTRELVGVLRVLR